MIVFTAMIQVIDKEATEASKVKAIVEVEESAANIKAAAAKAIKDDTEAELAVVMPILEAALQVIWLRSPCRSLATASQAGCHKCEYYNADMLMCCSMLTRHLIQSTKMTYQS